MASTYRERRQQTGEEEEAQVSPWGICCQLFYCSIPMFIICLVTAGEKDRLKSDCTDPLFPIVTLDGLAIGCEIILRIWMIIRLCAERDTRVRFKYFGAPLRGFIFLWTIVGWFMIISRYYTDDLKACPEGDWIHAWITLSFALKTIAMIFIIPFLLLSSCVICCATCGGAEVTYNGRPVGRGRQNDDLEGYLRSDRNASGRRVPQSSTLSQQNYQTRNVNPRNANIKRYAKMALGIDTVDDCTICYEDFQDDDMIEELPCKHYFHQACIQQWFESSPGRRCPICRQDVTTARSRFAEEEPPSKNNRSSTDNLISVEL